jgi:multidrug efflux pump subunit AcrA (membrane-fusion protein)
VLVTTGVHEDAPLVPEEALYTEGTTNYVYIVEDSTAHRREVVVGSIRDGMVEVLSGVRAGEIAISAGHQGLQEGAVVHIVERRETLQREP